MELDSLALIHLNWLFENHPDRVRELHQSEKLEALLDEKLQQALSVVDLLKRVRGLNNEEAFQIATELILAPSDGPATSENPPQPLPYREQRQILRRLEARSLAHERIENTRRSRQNPQQS